MPEDERMTLESPCTASKTKDFAGFQLWILKNLDEKQQYNNAAELLTMSRLLRRAWTGYQVYSRNLVRTCRSAHERHKRSRTRTHTHRHTHARTPAHWHETNALKYQVGNQNVISWIRPMVLRSTRTSWRSEAPPFATPTPEPRSVWSHILFLPTCRRQRPRFSFTHWPLNINFTLGLSLKTWTQEHEIQRRSSK